MIYILPLAGYETSLKRPRRYLVRTFTVYCFHIAAINNVAVNAAARFGVDWAAVGGWPDSGLGGRVD